MVGRPISTREARNLARIMRRWSRDAQERVQKMLKPIINEPNVSGVVTTSPEEIICPYCLKVRQLDDESGIPVCCYKAQEVAIYGEAAETGDDAVA